MRRWIKVVRLPSRYHFRTMIRSCFRCFWTTRSNLRDDNQVSSNGLSKPLNDHHDRDPQITDIDGNSVVRDGNSFVDNTNLLSNLHPQITSLSQNVGLSSQEPITNSDDGDNKQKSRTSKRPKQSKSTEKRHRKTDKGTGIGETWTIIQEVKVPVQEVPAKVDDARTTKLKNSDKGSRSRKKKSVKSDSQETSDILNPLLNPSQPEETPIIAPSSAITIVEDWAKAASQIPKHPTPYRLTHSQMLTVFSWQTAQKAMNYLGIREEASSSGSLSGGPVLPKANWTLSSSSQGTSVWSSDIEGSNWLMLRAEREMFCPSMSEGTAGGRGIAVEIARLLLDDNRIREYDNMLNTSQVTF